MLRMTPESGLCGWIITIKNKWKWLRWLGLRMSLDYVDEWNVNELYIKMTKMWG